MTTWQTIKRFLYPIQDYKGLFLILLIKGILFGSFVGGLSLIINQLLNAVQKGDINTMKIYLYYIGGLCIGRNILGFFARKWDFSLKIKIQSMLYKKYVMKYLSLDSNLVESRGTGSTNNVLIKGIDHWTGLLNRIWSNLIDIFVGIFSSFIIIFYYLGWKAVAILFIIFFVLFIIAQLGNKVVATYRKLKRDLYNQMDRDVIRILMSKFEILQNHKGDFETDKTTRDFYLAKEYYFKEVNGMLWSFDFPRFIVDLIRVIVLGYVGYGVINGVYNIGQLSMFWMIINIIDGKLNELNDFITNRHQSYVFVEKLWDRFDHTPSILGYQNGSKYNYNSGEIKFQNITYQYDSSNIILNKFSLIFQGGKKTALVGPSGGGKSTLIKLVAGYLHPQSGEILIDGQALPTPQNCHSEGSIAEGRNQNIDPSLHSGGHISLQSYYPHIGYLTQEPSVFDGTIWENLTYGMTEVQQNKDLEQTIDQVIKLSKCEFIYEFKDGLQTEIGEKGVRLSGGQRQRLAIAKIMLKDPSIILLDEPTSALDSYNEEQVTQALNNLFQGKTVIIIAHRLQTVKNADEILYIAKNEEANSSVIIERGTHAQLLELKGEYHTMVELQSGF